MMTPQEIFYSRQLKVFLFWSVIVKLLTKKHLPAMSEGSVYTRPTWMSVRALMALHKWYLAIYAFLFLSSAAGAMYADQVVVRVVVAICISAYHLVESSVTNRHGEFPLLYNAWAMILPEEYAHAASLGVAVHFILSSGVAKLAVGGLGWLRPTTMAHYFEVYRTSQVAKPLLPKLTQWLSTRAWTTCGFAIATIAAEVVLIPACGLFAPPGFYREVGYYAMIALHIGIALIMSGKVGIVFFTTLPMYILGFTCTASVGSMPWALAATTGLAPTLVKVALTGTLLSENWPSSPLSLFMWNGEQASSWAPLLLKGDTRLVMSSDDTMSHKELIGHTVVYHVGFSIQGGRKPVYDFRAPEGIPVVHDGVLRVLTHTFCSSHEALELLKLPPWKASELVTTLTAWLKKERRQIEAATGKPLVRCWIVRVDENDRVVAVVQG
jgi:hypothetical protein